MQKPGFTEAFQRTIEAWRQKHGLREDDAILLCLELFRLHQEHWDQIRREEFPAFREFRDLIFQLGGAARLFQRQSSALLDELHSHAHFQTSPAKLLPWACALAAGVGILIGKFLL